MRAARGTRMFKYEFECEVHGMYDDEVEAKNKEEALEAAKAAVEAEGMKVIGKICIRRIPKEEQG